MTGHQLKFERFISLSQREHDIFGKVKMGLSNKEVGESLFISEKTVKFHLTTIFEKLGVKNRYEMIVQYQGF